MGQLVFIGYSAGAPIGPLLDPLDLYVTSTGLDTNDGLTPLTPVLTMAGAYSKIPTRVLGAPVRIHVGTYPTLPWAPIPSYEQFNEQGQIIVYGDGAGQPGQNGFTTLVSSTAGAGTTNLSLDCTALAPPPNALQGATIEIAGQRRLVRDNTATAITPVAAFNPVPAPGAAYSLVIPAATIDLSAGDASACEGTDALYPTIINLGVSGGGANNSLLVDTTACLKLYGCLFTNLGYLSVRNSQVYAGLAEISTSNGRNGIHLPELWTALGGVQNWEGWGISSTGDLSQPSVIQSFTGYAVVNGLLWLLPESQFTFLGGYTGAVLADHALLDYQFPTQLIPTLARNAANQNAIVGSFLDIRVNNSLILEHVDNGGGLLLLTDSDVAWEGDCIPRILNNSNGLISMTGGRFELNGSLEFDIPLGAAVVCTLFDNGANVDIQGGFTINNDGPGFAALNLSHSAQVSVQDDVIVNSSVPQVYLGVLVAEGSKLLIGGDMTLSTPLIGVTLVAASYIQVEGTATVTDAQFGWTQSLQTQAIVTSMVLSGLSGLLCISSDLAVNGDVQIDTTNGAVFIGGNSNVQLAINGLCNINDSLGESPAIWVGQIPLSPTIGGTSNLTLQGNVTSTGGSAIQADTGSTVVFQGNGDLTAVFDVCVIADEANLIFNRAQSDAPTNIICPNPAAGINCTGGGHCAFTFGNDPPAFAVGGDELVVGPGLVGALPGGGAEQSTYAAALPNPGDGYSNAGASSSFSRRF